ncbi:MAG TPA: polyamine aminopropyltransferase [Acidimicrobiia bacterium]|nr:polyamine aminopropyltransferase [Acidimicrobiia bacterium]
MSGDRRFRVVLFAAAFACAACGLVYELALITLGSHLIGNTIHQASVVLSVMVFCMGIGSLLAKRLRHRPLSAFLAIEAALALVGGFSVLVLYAAFAWLDLYQPALLVVSAVVGTLIGAEIPVLVTLVHEVRADHPGDVAADLFAADYVGALVGGLAFPFLLLPAFGQIQGALVVGGVNVAAAAVVGALGRRGMPARARWAGGAALVGVLGVLGVALALAGRFEISARQALYDDPIVAAHRSDYQDIVMTESLSIGGRPDVRLFLNGDLQFSSIDEYRYHEALVHPAMAGLHRRVLVLGGGDGLALREVLRYPGVEEVTLVELDPAVLRLARADRRLARLNERSLADPRVTVVEADAFSWVRTAHEAFDVVIADFPDPEDPAIAKLYSVEFYGMAAQRALNPGGRLVVQGGSPYFAADAFWSIDATLRAAGFGTRPYHVDVPSFGDWGFVLARAGGRVPDLVLSEPPPEPLRFLSADVLRAAAVFPPDRGPREVEASTLNRPRILDYERRGWKEY